MKPLILIQLDTDPQPSVFDGVVAVDSGVDHLFRHGAVTPDRVRDLVHGALFTRGPADLKNTAVFVGGSDVRASESVLKAVTGSFFGPFRVSVLFDPNGCNTTAAAAVLALIEGANATRDGLDDATVAVLGATGPVGQRVARLVLGMRGEGASVRVGSRSLEKAESTANLLRSTADMPVSAFATADDRGLKSGLEGVDFVISAGAAGARLLPESCWRGSSLKVLIDLNAVPPTGIEGVEATDRGKAIGDVRAWGALGVGGTKMKIHKQALRDLFVSNDRVLDAEQCLAIGRSLA